MTAMRALLIIVVAALVGSAVASCSASSGSKPEAGRPAARSPAASAHPDLLVVGAEGSVISIDPRTGERLFSGTGVLALSDWTALFSADHTGRDTVVRAMDIRSGDVLARAEIEGDLAIRSVSADAHLVALMAPLPIGMSPWNPQPRAFTNVVVADPSGGYRTRRFHLDGNLEPEAFSDDDTGLFLIEYLPPEAPTGYRVVRLNLGDGKVSPVVTPQKVLEGPMSGTRLMQVASPGATTLFTLYTNQPHAYPAGSGPDQGASDAHVGFVHTLSLNWGWAHCVPLPRSLWGGVPANEAMAVSPDGSSLYVVDTARGVIAEMSVAKLMVEATVQVDFGSLAGSSTSAAVSPDGRTLFVGRGSSIMAIDTGTLVPRQTLPTSGPVSSLGLSTDGLLLYVAMTNEVEVLDASTGRAVRMIPAPGVRAIDHVGVVAA
jgi:hypothetical protein